MSVPRSPLQFWASQVLESTQLLRHVSLALSFGEVGCYLAAGRICFTLRKRAGRAVIRELSQWLVRAHILERNFFH